MKQLFVSAKSAGNLSQFIGLSRLAGIASLAGLALTVGASAQTAEQVHSATGVTTGLAVHVGATDGALAADLTKPGRMVTHVLAQDEKAVSAARLALAGQSLYGLASVERATTLPDLPYMDNLVNLLVVDADLLMGKAPSDAEMLRVLAPRGAAYIRLQGAWKVMKKELVRGMDEWKQFCYDAEGTCFSKDSLIGYSNALKWIAGPSEVSRMRMDWNSTPIVADGRMYHDSKTMSDDSRKGPFRYLGRDAFNGLPIWSVLREFDAGIHWQTLSAEGKIFTFLKLNDYPVALDGATGEVVRTYSNGLPQVQSKARDKEENYLSYAQGKLIQSAGPHLIVMDASTGAVAWKHSEPDTNVYLYLPTVDTKDNRLFVLARKAGTFKQFSRWPILQAEKVMAFDLRDGRPLWTNTEVKWDTTGQFSNVNLTLDFVVGQMLYENGRLALFGGHSLNRQHMRMNSARATLDAATGKILAPMFINHYVVGKPTPYSAVLSGGKVYTGSGAFIMRHRVDDWKADGYQPDVNDQPSVVASVGENQRCGRTHGGGSQVLFGFNTFLDTRKDEFTYTSITSVRCAMAGVPAYGMVYNAPTGCVCIKGQLVGHMALYHRKTPIGPVDDARRLEKSGLPGPDAVAAKATPIGGASPILMDWRAAGAFNASGVVSATSGAYSLTTRIHDHRVDATKDGKIAWSFATGGRITSAPVVAGGRVYVGSHDGYLYCLRLEDGRPEWRFLGAPQDRRIVAHGQVESAWPVYGLAMHGGKICFSAGRHAETDGGIWVYGLEPSTGAMAWKKRVRVEHVTLKAGTKTTHYANTMKNGALRSSGAYLELPGVQIDPASGDVVRRLTSAPPASVGNQGRFPAARTANGASPSIGQDGFHLPRAGYAVVRVLDANGRQVAVLFEGLARAGFVRYRYVPPEDLAPGRYIFELQALGQKIQKAFRKDT